MVIAKLLPASVLKGHVERKIVELEKYYSNEGCLEKSAGNFKRAVMSRSTS